MGCMAQEMEAGSSKTPAMEHRKYLGRQVENRPDVNLVRLFSLHLLLELLLIRETLVSSMVRKTIGKS